VTEEVLKGGIVRALESKRRMSGEIMAANEPAGDLHLDLAYEAQAHEYYRQATSLSFSSSRDNEGHMGLWADRQDDPDEIQLFHGHSGVSSRSHGRRQGLLLQSGP
jgi:hypothetical protein